MNKGPRSGNALTVATQREQILVLARHNGLKTLVLLRRRLCDPGYKKEMA